MISFKPIQVSDYETVAPILAKSGIENCDHCFATMFVWSHRHNIEIAVEDNTVFMRSFGIEHRWYLYPAGDMDREKAIGIILEDAAANNIKRSIYGIDEENRQFLMDNFSQQLEVKEDRDGSDYIYNASDLINLPGKNYQKKRNHCSRFIRENPEYRFVRITEDNVDRAKQFELDWCARYDCGSGRDLDSEQKGIMALLDNFGSMGLMGGMIETDGEIVAMSIAAPINDRMVDVIVEKAYHDVNGAYAIINRDFAANCFGSFEYINREDDMGAENLRKAKMSYFPCEIRKKYLAQRLWNENFDDGTGFCDFAFSLVTNDDIYIVTEDEKVVSMLMAVTELEYKGKKGFYLYSACTAREYRGRGYMHALVEYALQDQKEKGNTFCVLQPAGEKLFEFWKTMGFEKTISMRKCEIEIKRNIWKAADFDIITSSRFRRTREKFAEENMVHYTPKSYEKYTRYMYTCGGSTAESENAYAVYFVEKSSLVVKELLASSTLYATHLLQAIRERTGCETATVYLSDNSTLFLGEGKKEKVYAVKGLDEDVYVNLMFE